MQMNRALLIALAIVVVLVVIYVFRHIQGDPLEHDRLRRARRSGSVGVVRLSGFCNIALSFLTVFLQEPPESRLVGNQRAAQARRKG